MKRDRFTWAETDNTALVEMITINGVTLSAIIRDFGHYQSISVSENDENKCIRSLYANDLEQFKRKIPFFIREA